MSAEGRAQMVQIAESLIQAFLKSAEEKFGEQKLTGPVLREWLPSFQKTPLFGRIMRDAHTQLLDAAAAELLRHQRGDPLQRLLVHPLTDLFEDGQLSRDILPAYFSFFHLVLGDEKDAFGGKCVAILEELKGPDHLTFSWDSFYDDPRAKSVLWAILLRVAEAFRRFDARRDWFIGLMENRPQSISLGTSAFLPRPSSEELVHFRVNEFNLLFAALYEPLRRLQAAELADFTKQFGGSPEKVLVRFFQDLAASGASL